MPGGFGFEDEEHGAGYSEHGAGYSEHGAGYSEHGAGYSEHGAGYSEHGAGGGGASSGAQGFSDNRQEPPPQSAPSPYGPPEPAPRPWGPTSRPLGPTSRPLGQGGPSWGGYGQPAQPSGWGQFGPPAQPAQPAQPSGGFYGQPGPVSGWGGYGQPAAPAGWGPPSGAGVSGAYGSGSEWSSGPAAYGGYGTAAPSSQGWSGTEVAPYAPGGYAPDRYVPGGYGPPSQYLAGGYGTYGGYGESTGRGWVEATARSSSRKRLWVTLGVVAALLIVALAGAGYAVFAVFTPQAAVGTFCDDLRLGRYAEAYNLLEGGAQSQVTTTGFAQAQVTLAHVAGGIVRCGVDNATTTYQYHPGDADATIGVAIEWASAGKMSGWAHLKNDNGWKIAALDSSVFGVNLGALSAVTTYCEALVDQNYPAVYEVLGSQQRAQVQGQDYAQLGQWQDTIDGPVKECQVLHVGSGNTDIVAHLPVTMTRSKLGQRQDDVALEVESGVWKITSIGPQLQGTDIGGLAVGVRFCSDLAKGDYADAFTLATGAGESEDAFARSFNGQDSGIKLANCASDVSTYKVSGASATLDTEWNIERQSDGATGHGTVTESLTKLGNGWKVSNLTPKK